MRDEHEALDYSPAPLARPHFLLQLGPALAWISFLVAAPGAVLALLWAGGAGEYGAFKIAVIAGAVCAMVALAGIPFWDRDAVLLPVLLALTFVGFWCGMAFIVTRYGGLGK